ncbi:MAG: hypothetical protein WA749_14895, partial [Gelidibacter sp.]
MKTTEKEAWFLSAFRPEAQTSFIVSKNKNRWYDHGEGVGGKCDRFGESGFKMSCKGSFGVFGGRVLVSIFNSNNISVKMKQ